MAYLDYYIQENRRHSDALKVKIDFATAKEMTKVVCKHFGLRMIPTKLFVKGAPEFKRLRKVRSWYNRAGKFIVYHPEMLNPLLVAHEVGHYVDHMQCLKIKKTRRMAHTPRHAAITDEAVALLKDTYRALFTGPTSVAETPKAHSGGDVVQRFFESLPQKLTCPCCKFYGHKMNFGVRVMKKNAKGMPVVLRRQSYCKACR